ncbi:hypothetical protein OSH11_14815 [Kaistia dalseonensis]|uniref:Glucosamine inositolphosphorylceramide transferase 1 N-terminal domain-containing protein n=1 Tax=Kaistia dalseonensis TaxID=410840 RepID=A0ABU0H8F1_9HYPH|nr:hypothetical protein [Kaistia dalseonensis]MCX5495983.1 hypothetical protein [Kaistia dalseonensis]MDQ0438586.1 hypothetical protein [Kaistia dalseonensis]
MAMRIAVKLDPARLRAWQVHVVESLATAGHAVTVVAHSVPDPWPESASLLLRLESLLFGIPSDSAMAERAWSALDRPGGDSGKADLVVDLANGTADPPQSDPTLGLTCDGGPFETGILAAILDRRTPVLATSLSDEGGRRDLTQARPAVESPDNAAAALGMLYGRAAAMLLRDVARLEHGMPAGLAPVAGISGGRGPAAFLVDSLRRRVVRRLDRLLGRGPTWHVALRTRQGAAGFPALGPHGFRRLADDGARFYADPFLWQAEGRTFLLVEEFPYATGKGVISCAEISSDGTVSPPRIVLETDCHLSYPFVFAHDGAIWMIPETSGRRTVELYRADPFPASWTLHAVLMDDIDLSDVTIEQIGDRWWMFGASRARWTSSWDALSLFHAPSPFGPWTAHLGNPVKVDLTAARPAGRLMRIDGQWIRPAQDSAGGYGAALAFTAIERLSETDFAERVLSRVRPWGDNTGLHSYDRTGAVEAIDLFGPRSA